MNGFLKTADQEKLVPLKRDLPFARQSGFCRREKAMDGVKKKKGSHALIEVLTAWPKRFQIRAFCQQLLQRGLLAEKLEWLVTHAGVRGDDDVLEFACHGICGWWW